MLRIFKSSSLTIWCIGLAFPLLLSATMPSFFHECDSLEQEQHITVDNLISIADLSKLDALGVPVIDKTALAMQTAQSGDGSIIYEVTDAEQIEVLLYTKEGTTATKYNGAVVIGNPNDVDISNQYSIKTYGDDGVYTTIEGKNYRLVYQFGKKFTETDSMPKNTKDLALNIYTSADGKTYSRVGNFYTASSEVLKKSSFPPSIRGYCEKRLYKIPPKARYIKVELSNYMQIPQNNGGIYQNAISNPVMLGSVKISGSHFSMGAPVIPVPPSPSTSSSSPAPSSSSSSPAPSSSSSEVSGNPSFGGGIGGDTNTAPPSSASSSKPKPSSSSKPKESTSKQEKPNKASKPSKDDNSNSKSNNSDTSHSSAPSMPTTNAELQPNKTIVGDLPTSDEAETGKYAISVIYTIIATVGIFFLVKSRIIGK